MVVGRPGWDRGGGGGYGYGIYVGRALVKTEKIYNTRDVGGGVNDDVSTGGGDTTASAIVVVD